MQTINPRALSGLAMSAMALAAAGPAAADVTAQDVWEAMQGSLDLYGSAVTYGEPVMSGTTLTVPDVALQLNEPGASLEGNFGTITFAENGDGTVSVTSPDEISLAFSPEAQMSDADRAEIVIRQPDVMLTVSGTPEQMVFDYVAPRIEMVLGPVIVESAPADISASLALIDLSGNYTMRTGDARQIDYSFNAGAIEILGDGTSPDNEEFFFSGRITDLGSEASVTIPPGFTMDMEPEDAAALFADGFAVSGNYTVGPAAYMFDFNGLRETASGTLSTQSSELAVGFAADALNYNVRMTGLDVSVETNQLPFPIQVTAAEYGAGLSIPIARTEEPVDFSASINISELAVNEGIWQLADPTGQLPHDPATMIIDLSGTARMLFDLTDPAQAEAMAMAPMPGEIHSLNLDELNVSIAGAQLTGGGSFTFDNTDQTTFPGMPRPEGEVGLKLVGGNGLIDKLVAMGLVPQDAVMQGRMMMGMFANVTGDDQLETTVQVNDQGHLIVNGQRLQ